jgi:hypothetical protein
VNVSLRHLGIVILVNYIQLGRIEVQLICKSYIPIPYQPNSEQRAAQAATDGRHAVPSIGFSGGKTATKVTFVISVIFGLIGLCQSLRDSILSNQSHFTELDNTISKDDPYYGAGAP